MRKYELLQSGDGIIRVLEIQDKVLIIDCVKQSMPVWVEPTALDSFSPCPDTALVEVTGTFLPDADTLDTDQRKIMYDRYTMIAPVLPFLADDRMRSQVICSIAKEQRTVNLETMSEDRITVTGRHDPCIVPRAVAVVEAMAAIALMDQELSFTPF